MKELSSDRNPFDDHVRVNGRLLIHDEKQVIPNSITSDEVSPLVNNVTSERSMETRAASPNKSEIIFSINALKSSKPALTIFLQSFSVQLQQSL